MISKLLQGWLGQWLVNPQVRRQVAVGLGHGCKGGFSYTGKMKWHRSQWHHMLKSPCGHSPKLPKVPVDPLAHVQQSSTPAIWRSFLGTGADTIPVPLGAGMRRTSTDPHLPVTCVRNGMHVCTMHVFLTLNTDTWRMELYLARHSVRLTNLVAPVPHAHWDDRELSQHDGTSNGCSHFLGALDPQSNVPVAITNSHNSLEAGSLASPCLLLHWHNLHHLIFERRTQKVVNDLRFLC